MTTSLKKVSLVLVSVVSTIAVLSAPFAFSATPGKACAKVGTVAKSATASLRCVKNGKKLVWQVVKATKPSPKPTKVATSPGTSSTPTSAPTLSSLPAQTSYDITVAASQWNFAFTYFVDGRKTPLSSAPSDSSLLYVPEGKLVHFTLTSADTTHGFWIPGLLINTAIDPGAMGHLDFTADKLGTFPGRCNVSSCGRGHAGMTFTVKVVSADEYLKYLSSLK